MRWGGGEGERAEGRRDGPRWNWDGKIGVQVWSFSETNGRVSQRQLKGVISQSECWASLIDT